MMNARQLIKDSIPSLKKEGDNRAEQVLIEWTIYQILKILREAEDDKQLLEKL